MKTLIAGMAVVLCISFVSECESIVANDAPRQREVADTTVSNRVLTITDISGNVLRTRSGDFRLSRSFKIYIRKEGQVLEEQDLSLVPGANRKVHFVGEEVTWILLEAQEARQ